MYYLLYYFVERLAIIWKVHLDMTFINRLVPEQVNLDLSASSKEEILHELISMLNVDDQHKDIFLEMVLQREQLGSTGLGGGVAIPHGRSLLVNDLHLICGVSKKGIYYQALDRKKVFLFFLIIAPHREVSNQYLPLLGNLAKIASDPETVQRLRNAENPDHFLEIIKNLFA